MQRASCSKVARQSARGYQEESPSPRLTSNANVSQQPFFLTVSIPVRNELLHLSSSRAAGGTHESVPPGGVSRRTVVGCETGFPRANHLAPFNEDQPFLQRVTYSELSGAFSGDSVNFVQTAR